MSDNDDGEVIEVTCGNVNGKLHMKLFTCPGIRNECIEAMGEMVTPKGFTIIGEKERLKDWKNAIRVDGKSIRRMIMSGELDFYKHDEICSGRCLRSANSLQDESFMSSPSKKRKIKSPSFSRSPKIPQRKAHKAIEPLSISIQNFESIELTDSEQQDNQEIPEIDGPMPKLEPKEKTPERSNGENGVHYEDSCKEAPLLPKQEPPDPEHYPSPTTSPAQKMFSSSPRQSLLSSKHRLQVAKRRQTLASLKDIPYKKGSGKVARKSSVHIVNAFPEQKNTELTFAKHSKIPGVIPQDIEKDSMKFWGCVLDVGLLDEFLNEMKDSLFTIKNDLIKGAATFESTRKLSGVARELGLASKLKSKLMMTKSKTDLEKAALLRQIEVLKRRLGASERREADLIRQAATISQMYKKETKKRRRFSPLQAKIDALKNANMSPDIPAGASLLANNYLSGVSGNLSDLVNGSSLLKRDILDDDYHHESDSRKSPNLSDLGEDSGSESVVMSTAKSLSLEFPALQSIVNEHSVLKAQALAANQSGSSEGDNDSNHSTDDKSEEVKQGSSKRKATKARKIIQQEINENSESEQE